MSLFSPTKGYSTLDFQSNSNTRITTSASGKTHRRKVGAQSWTLKIQSPAMSKDDFLADYSFIVQQDGQFGSFTIVPPEIGSTRGTATGTVTVVDDSTILPLHDNSRGSASIGVSGGNGILKKGDLIKFSNHDKVYMLTADCNLDGSTVDTLTFHPPLVTGVDTSTIQYTSVPLKVFMDTDTVKFITQTDGTYKYELVLNEEI